MRTEKEKPIHNASKPTPGGWVKVVIIFFSMIAFLGLCYLLKGILTSLLLAFTVAYIFDPVVDFIESRSIVFPTIRIHRTIAVVILLISVFILGSLFMAYAIPKTISGAVQVARALKREYPHYQKGLEELLKEYGQVALLSILRGEEPQAFPTVTEVGVPPEQKEERAFPYLPGQPFGGLAVQLKGYIPSVLQYLFNAIKNLFYSTFGLVGTMANFFTFTFVSIYLLKDYDRILSEAKALIPPSRKDRVLELMGKVDNTLRGFLRGQMTVAIILGFFYSAGLSLIGVPMAFFVGFLAGIGNMIPLLGTTVGIILAMSLVALEHPGGLGPFALVGITFALGQFLEGTVLTPRILGSRVGLHPVAIILSVLIWGQILGFLGLLMAVPTTSALMVFVGEALKRYKESIAQG